MSVKFEKGNKTFLCVAFLLLYHSIIKGAVTVVRVKVYNTDFSFLLKPLK